MKFTPRLSYFYAFLSVVLMCALALYLQYWKGISPCPLCIIQRIVMLGIGTLFFIGMIFNFKKVGQIILGMLVFIFALGGALFAGRQIWIQHLPADQTVDCGVSLQYMLHVLPWDEVAKKILQGSAECSLVDWSFLNLSMAEWSFICFGLFIVFALRQMVRAK